MKDIFLLVTAYLTVYQQLMCTNGSCKSPHLQRNTQPQTCVLSRVPTPAATARIFLSRGWSRGEGGGSKVVRVRSGLFIFGFSPYGTNLSNRFRTGLRWL